MKSDGYSLKNTWKGSNLKTGMHDHFSLLESIELWSHLSEYNFLTNSNGYHDPCLDLLPCHPPPSQVIVFLPHCDTIKSNVIVGVISIVSSI